MHELAQIQGLIYVEAFPFRLIHFYSLKRFLKNHKMFLINTSNRRSIESPSVRIEFRRPVRDVESEMASSDSCG